MSHTKGPWGISKVGNNYDEFTVYSETENPGADLCHIVRGGRSNAELIAAAPEMLKVLHSAAGWFGELGNDDGAQGLLDDIRAAIAKAEGRS